MHGNNAFYLETRFQAVCLLSWTLILVQE